MKIGGGRLLKKTIIDFCFLRSRRFQNRGEREVGWQGLGDPQQCMPRSILFESHHIESVGLDGRRRQWNPRGNRGQNWQGQGHKAFRMSTRIRTDFPNPRAVPSVRSLFHNDKHLCLMSINIYDAWPIKYTHIASWLENQVTWNGRLVDRWPCASPRWLMEDLTCFMT